MGISISLASAVFAPVAAHYFARWRKWVVAVQVAVFACGIFMLYLERPVYLVFALDRFELVAAIDLSARDLADAKAESFKRRPLNGPKYVAAVLPSDEQSRQRLLDSSLQGKDLQRYPMYYAPYQVEAGNALKRAKPISTVYERDPKSFDRFLEASGRTRDSVRVLPLRAKKRDGVVLLDAASGEPLVILLVEPW